MNYTLLALCVCLLRR